MTTKHKPATPLPWKPGNSEVTGIHAEDAAYMAHAANAYPSSIKFAKLIAKDADALSWEEMRDAAKDLLRELGEAE